MLIVCTYCQLSVDVLLPWFAQLTRKMKATPHASMAPAIFRPFRYALGDIVPPDSRCAKGVSALEALRDLHWNIL